MSKQTENDITLPKEFLRWPRLIGKDPEEFNAFAKRLRSFFAMQGFAIGNELIKFAEAQRNFEMGISKIDPGRNVNAVDDEKLFHILMIACDSGKPEMVLQQVSGESGVEAWKALLDIYRPISRTSLMGAVNTVMQAAPSYGPDGELQIEEFMLQIHKNQERLLSLCNGSVESLADAIQQYILLSRLETAEPEVFGPFGDIVRNTQTELSLERIKSMAREHMWAAKLKLEAKREADEKLTMVVGKKIMCYECNKEGHIRRDCPQWKEKQKNMPNGGKGSEKGSGKQKRQDVGTLVAAVKELLDENRQRSSQQIERDPDEESYAFATIDETEMNEALSMLAKDTPSGISGGAWLIDGGSQVHVTPFKEDLVNIVKAEKAMGGFTKNMTVDVKAIGTAQFRVRARAGTDEKTVTIELLRTRYVPNARFRILSAGALMEKGATFILQNENSKVVFGDVELPLTRVGRWHFLQPKN